MASEELKNKKAELKELEERLVTLKRLKNYPAAQTEAKKIEENIAAQQAAEAAQAERKAERNRQLEELWKKYHKDEEEPARQKYSNLKHLSQSEPEEIEELSITDMLPEERKEYTTSKEKKGRNNAPKINLLNNVLEKEEVEKELKNISPEDRVKIGWGLNTIGYKVERSKNNFFASALSKFEGKKNTGLNKFIQELRDSFVRDAAEAERKAVEIQEGKGKFAKTRSGALLVGNILKYGRIVADLTGASIANPLRYVMMGGMATTRMAEAGKEARLKNEEVVEKTRVQNEKDAADLAWQIYENAQKEAVAKNEKNVSADTLKKAYLMQMPADLQYRLDLGTSNFLQIIMQTQISVSLEFLNYRISSIDENTKLSPEEKNAKKEKLMRKWQKDLNDYDRILTQYGTVDEMAMGLRYLQKLGKGIVLGMQIETAVLSAEKLWGTVANLFHHHETVSAAIENTGSKSVVRHPENLPRHLPKAETVPKTETVATATHPEEKIPTAVKPEVKVPPEVNKVPPVVKPEVKIPTTAPAAPETVATINPDAFVGQKEGIEHAFIRQIEHNETLAKHLGWNGKGDLHKFAQGEAHRLAIKEGYVSKEGAEIRIRGNGKVAYEIKIDDKNNPMVEESLNGKIIETHHAGDTLEQGDNLQKNYEYKYGGPKHHEGIAGHKEHMGTKESAPVQSAKATTTDTEQHASTPVHEAAPSHAEALKAEIEQKISVAEKTREAVREPVTIRTGTEIRTGTSMQTGTTVGTGAFARPIHMGGGGLEHPGDAYVFPGLSPEDNHLLNLHPEFISNPLHLSPEQLVAACKASDRNMEFLFRHDPQQLWHSWQHSKASLVLAFNDPPNKSTDAGIFAGYLRALKNASGLSPKSGLFGMRPENAGQYSARVLQALAKKGELEKFEAALTK